MHKAFQPDVLFHGTKKEKTEKSVDARTFLAQIGRKRFFCRKVKAMLGLSEQGWMVEGESMRKIVNHLVQLQELLYCQERVSLIINKTRGEMRAELNSLTVGRFKLKDLR